MTTCATSRRFTRGAAMAWMRGTYQGQLSRRVRSQRRGSSVKHIAAKQSGPGHVDATLFFYRPDHDLVGLKVRESRFDVLQIGCEPLHALILLFGALGVSLAGIHRARVRVAARLSRADGALVSALKQRTESARGVCGGMVREAELYL